MAVLLALDLHGGGALAVGKVKVCEDDVAAAVQQDVLWLQVPVHEALEVQILQRHQHLQEPRQNIFSLTEHHQACALAVLSYQPA